jgi:hypothetical protein
MKAMILLLLITLVCFEANAQSDKIKKPHYYQIPDYPESYSAETVVARLIDGLGFRYFWATEGLRVEDLEFRPNEDARTTAETIDHIYGLSKVIVNATDHKANEGGDEPALTFMEKRNKTLENIQRASKILKAADSQDLDEYTMVFKRGEQATSYPYWNLINGPISDAVWHCGQVVLLRRSSGNPFNSNVSVLQGKVRE